jgi:hypothetical protein
MADNAQTASTTVARRSNRVLGYDLDWWNAAMLVALGFGAFAAVLVVVATTGVIISQKRDATAASNEFERYKVDAGERIAGAEERAAEANRTAEGERLARVKLEAQLAGRRLTDEQKAKLASALAAMRSQLPSITVMRLGDKEAHEYATDFIRVIHGVGIPVSIEDIGNILPPRYGIESTSDLRTSFEKAELKLTRVFGENEGYPSPRILIGLKLPPF